MAMRLFPVLILAFAFAAPASAVTQVRVRSFPSYGPAQFQLAPGLQTGKGLLGGAFMAQPMIDGTAPQVSMGAFDVIEHAKGLTPFRDTPAAPITEGTQSADLESKVLFDGSGRPHTDRAPVLQAASKNSGSSSGGSSSGASFSSGGSGGRRKGAGTPGQPDLSSIIETLKAAGRKLKIIGGAIGSREGDAVVTIQYKQDIFALSVPRQGNVVILKLNGVRSYEIKPNTKEAIGLSDLLRKKGARKTGVVKEALNIVITVFNGMTNAGTRGNVSGTGDGDIGSSAGLLMTGEDIGRNVADSGPKAVGGRLDAGARDLLPHEINQETLVVTKGEITSDEIIISMRDAAGAVVVIKGQKFALTTYVSWNKPIFSKKEIIRGDVEGWVRVLSEAFKNYSGDDSSTKDAVAAMRSFLLLDVIDI